jgi:hypothetical protein
MAAMESSLRAKDVPHAENVVEQMAHAEALCIALSTEGFNTCGGGSGDAHAKALQVQEAHHVSSADAARHAKEDELALHLRQQQLEHEAELAAKGTHCANP